MRTSAGDHQDPWGQAHAASHSGASQRPHTKNTSRCHKKDLNHHQIQPSQGEYGLLLGCARGRGGWHLRSLLREEGLEVSSGQESEVAFRHPQAF